MGHSGSVFSCLCWWDLAVAGWVCPGSLVWPACSWDWCPCEQEPALLQHLNQHMLWLWPSATERDGEKEGLGCEALLSVLWICWYIMLMTLDLSLSHCSLERCWDDQSPGDCTKQVRFKKQRRGQRGCLGIGVGLGETQVIEWGWKMFQI